MNECEYRIISNHSVKWIRAKRIPIRDSNGNVIRVFGTVQDISDAKKIEDAKIQLAAQQSFTKQLLMSQEAERKRISQELHDSLGQDILLIKNRAQLVLHGEKLDSFAIEQLNKINESSADLLNLVRDISFNLRPAHLERLGLTETIISLIKKVDDTTQINISNKIENIDKLFNSEEEINLYRIIQEGLSNIVKHSNAENAEINIYKTEDHLDIEIFDDGIGIDINVKENKIKGFGLVNLLNRVNILKGELIVNSEELKGLRLIIKIPLNKS
jgi:signal transduction histidine kinase